MLDNEPQLITDAREGNKASFAALYDHYVTQIYRFVYLKTGSKHEAEDLTHDVFLSAWQSIGTYTNRGFPFSSWLYHIARNKIIDRYRTAKATTTLDDVAQTVADFSVHTESATDEAMQLERVKLAMRELSDEHQNVLILRFVEDMSPADIAATIGKSEGAVRLIQHRAIKNLRAILTPESENSNDDTLV